MNLNQFKCQPCEHRWWQHRDPDPRMRQAGLALMVIGVIQCAAGAGILLSHLVH